MSRLLDRILEWFPETFGVYGLTMRWVICYLIYCFPIYFLPIPLLATILIGALFLFTGSFADILHPLVSLAALYFVLRQPLDTLGIIYLVYFGVLTLGTIIPMVIDLIASRR